MGLHVFLLVERFPFDTCCYSTVRPQGCNSLVLVSRCVQDFLQPGMNRVHRRSLLMRYACIRKLFNNKMATQHTQYCLNHLYMDLELSVSPPISLNLPKQWGSAMAPSSVRKCRPSNECRQAEDTRNTRAS